MVADSPFVPTLALTLGDPGGIGPEVVLKALAAADASYEPVVVGGLDALAAHAARLRLGEAARVSAAMGRLRVGGRVVPVVDVAEGVGGDVPWGRATAGGGRLSMRAVEAAVALCRLGEADGVVTAPISKEAIALAGYDVPGHTEFLARLCADADGRAPEPLMVLAAEDGLPAPLRVGLVTVHVPLRRVPDLVTREAILARRRTLEAALRLDWGIPAPRVAVLGLNPHAGDGGVLGSEERDVIEPAIAACRAEGLATDGPFPADGFFASNLARYDGVLAMYHDQGLAPFKALAFDAGVNVTCGLPIVRTSPDHGTAYAIAGKNVASPASMTAACRLAARVAHARRAAA